MRNPILKAEVSSLTVKAGRSTSRLSSVRPAHASATTWTPTPASAAATAVDSTQQSVDTPASTSPLSPTRAASCGPHLLNVVASSVGPGPEKSPASW